jgi:Rod binding domain-containing protein
MELSVLPNSELERGESRLQALRGHRKNPAQEKERLQSAAKEFEQIMMEFMVASMRKNVPESPLFPHNNGLEIFNEMLDSQYARLMVDRGGFGLANLMVRQLSGK